MKNLSRSTALKAAAVISFLLSAYSIVVSLPMIAAGEAANNNNPQSIPFVGLMLGLVLGVIGVIAAYGAWKQQRWGVILTILVNLVNSLLSSPGILDGPNAPFFISALMTVIPGVLIIMLCLWPGRQTATA